MIRNAAFCILFCFSTLLFAQITVESVTTDTIDLFTPAQNKSESRFSGAAMALSLLVPGLGHQLTERPNAALAYLTFDILSIAGVVFGERYSRQLEKDAKGFAAMNAGTNGNIKDERFWQMVGAYDRTSDYNNDVRLMRESSDKLYNDESFFWYWNSDEAKKKYNQLRDNSRKLHIVSSFCIGAMVLNRVIAFVDVRASTRYRKTRINTSFSVQPSINQPGVTMSIDY